MAQFARPSSDVAAGTWTATPLWQKIDEASPSDADAITSADNASIDTCEVALAAVSDPATSTGHLVRYRFRKHATGGHNISLVVELMQGTTTIATWTEPSIGATYTTQARTLTGGEADTITDYGNLRLRLSRTGDTGGNPGNRRSAQVSWAELEVPDAAPAGQNVAVAAAAETEAAGTTTPAPGGATLAVAAVGEGETAAAADVTIATDRQITTADEADLAGTIAAAAGPVTIAAAAAVETEQARTIAGGTAGGPQNVLVGTAVETDLAVTIAAAAGPVTIAAAAAVETEQARTTAAATTGGPQSLGVSAAAETEAGRAAGLRLRVPSVGELEAAASIAGHQLVAVAAAGENETARAATYAGLLLLAIGHDVSRTLDIPADDRRAAVTDEDRRATVDAEQRTAAR